MPPLLRAGLETALIIGLTAPLIAVAMLRSRVRSWPPLVAALALFALDNLVLRTPRIAPFADLAWNWQGKLLGVAWVLVLAAVVPSLSLREIGLTAPLRPGWRTPALVVGGVTLVLPLIFALLGAREPLTPEGWAFEATLPGLAEELVYRGVLLALCDRAMGRPWRIAGAEVGWGMIVTSVLFALEHGIVIDRAGALHVEPLLAIGPLVGGVLGGWARARIGSLVPLIAFHNASNLIIPCFGT